MKVVEFEIPEATILLNQWQRKHWAERKKYHERLAWEVRQALGNRIPSVPITKRTIHIERRSAGVADWDGVMGGLKPLFDCLVVQSRRNPLGLGVIEDDNPNCIIESPTIKQIKSKRGMGATRVVITEVEQEQAA